MEIVLLNIDIIYQKYSMQVFYNFTMIRNSILPGLQCENVVFINSCGPGKCFINCGYCYVTSLNDVLLEYNV